MRRVNALNVAAAEWPTTRRTKLAVVSKGIILLNSHHSSYRLFQSMEEHSQTTKKTEAAHANANGNQKIKATFHLTDDDDEDNSKEDLLKPSEDEKPRLPPFLSPRNSEVEGDSDVHEDSDEQTPRRRNSAYRRVSKRTGAEGSESKGIASDRLPAYPTSISRKHSTQKMGPSRNSTRSSAPYHIPSPNSEPNAKSSNTGISIPNSSVSIGMSRFPHAKEFGESINVKIRELFMISAVVIVNILIIILANGFTDGITIAVPPSVVRYAGGVVIEIVLLISNILTIMAVDAGACIYISGLLTNTKKGYSMAACGFMHTMPMLRTWFTDQLSLSSPCRKMLHRVSFIWLILEAAKLLSPICATGISTELVYTLSTSTACLRYDAIDLMDRGYPTLESTLGVSELIFGSALGCMRSEGECGHDHSDFVVGPQLSGVVSSGDTIKAEGFTTDVASNCKCYNITSSLPTSRGLLKAGDGEEVLRIARNQRTPFLYHAKPRNRTANTFTSVHVLGNTNGCGGYSDSLVPVCLTNFSEFLNVEVLSTFQTDGTTASIALTKSEVLADMPIHTANVTDLMFALDTIMPPGSHHYFPSTVPGMASTVLYWMTYDLISINPSQMSKGMETTLSILIRAGMQRTFTMTGITCRRFVARDDVSKVFMKPWGYASLYATGVVQVIFSLIGLALGFSWVLHKHPITPALRALRDPSYFMTLLADSPFSINLAGTANAPSYVFWQALDMVVKIGESVDTLSEPIGHVRMEREKFVRPLSNEKAYY
ncbi:hypothetical protein HDU67_004028 [Dinochytrium kinnereticum]|nr:hypothetical protein HDU67_004028 [Dinochytrium kinnereticum]